jgi:tRNA (Thr-GGU) A37 N-methylase
MTTYSIKPIGYVHSSLTSREDAPRQGDEGAPEAWLEIKPEFTAGLKGINAGDELFLLTWLHLSDRQTLQVHPLPLFPGIEFPACYTKPVETG